MSTDAAALRDVSAVVARSGSSFTMGMRMLPPARRHAMFAVYAFCREIDDIADEPGEAQDKLRRLGNWRSEVEAIYDGTPATTTGTALAGAVRAYALPRAEFLALIDGMEMDARDGVWAPPMTELRLYCRRVAGAVGLLSINIFGDPSPRAQEFAIALGEAFQLTNILRDVDEDLDDGRLYLPRELLEARGVPFDAAAEDVRRHAGLPAACRDLAQEARRRFQEADVLLAGCDRRALRPAVLMWGIYERTLDRLERTGWQPDTRRVRLSKPAKLWAALARLLRR